VGIPMLRKRTNAPFDSERPLSVLCMLCDLASLIHDQVSRSSQGCHPLLLVRCEVYFLLQEVKGERSLWQHGKIVGMQPSSKQRDFYE